MNCGRVDDSYISEEADWTSGMDRDGNVSDPSRCGQAVDTGLFSSKWGMGTIMGTYGQSYAVKKLARINFHSSMNHRDRALFHAYAEFDTIKNKLLLNDTIIRTAKIMYKEFTETKLTRGTVRAGVKANCVFMACKTHGVPRTTKEIAEAFDISTRDIGRTAETLNDNTKETVSVNITRPRDVVVRIVEHLDLGDDKKRIRRLILNVCEKVENLPILMGKTPSGVASAIIFMVLSKEGVNVSKSTVCSAASISIPTLNKIETLLKHEIV
jgi:transcription initiation factor TFIIIB Brf1 subunit/transcription initiation factor TFIIB